MTSVTNNNDSDHQPIGKNSIVMLKKSVDPGSGLNAGKIGIVVAIHSSNINEEDSIEILFEGQSQSQSIYPVVNGISDNTLFPLITVARKEYPIIHPPKTIHHFQ